MGQDITTRIPSGAFSDTHYFEVRSTARACKWLVGVLSTLLDQILEPTFAPILIPLHIHDNVLRVAVLAKEKNHPSLVDMLQAGLEIQGEIIQLNCLPGIPKAIIFQTDEGKRLSRSIADEDNISVGDYVIVPVGKDNHHSVAEVVKVEYFAEEDVPLPLDRTKHIIRKCTDEDFDPPEVDQE